MALLRRGDMSATATCFTVGFSSLGIFGTRFTELVGVPPGVYREQDVGDMAGVAPCVAKVVTRPIRNREAQAATITSCDRHGYHDSLSDAATHRPGGHDGLLGVRDCVLPDPSGNMTRIQLVA